MYDDPQAVKTYIYDQLFLLAYHVHMPIEESYRLPVRLRNWFVRKLGETKEKEALAQENALNAN